MYCDQCGALIEADSKFCAQCGNKLHNSSASHIQTQSEAPRETEKDSTSTRLVVVGICILAALVGTLLFSVVYKSQKGSEFVVKWKDRKVRIAAGSGLERLLPDTLLRKIVDETILPHL